MSWKYDNVRKCYIFQEGGVIKAQTGWHVYFNPKNWGVSRDYERDQNGNMRSFDNTYAAARQAGEKEFLWNGTRYSTDFENIQKSPQKQQLKTQLTSKQYKLAEGVWNYLLSKNVSPKNIAAIMGNIIQESSFIRNAKQIGGDSAEGLFQMHGQDLRAYNNWKTKNSGNLGEYPELDYILYMIKSGDHPYSNEYKRVSQDPSKQAYVQQIYGDRIKNSTLYLIDDLSKAWEDRSTSLDYMTDLFTNTIERAGRPEYNQRRKYASDFYEHFNGIR